MLFAAMIAVVSMAVMPAAEICPKDAIHDQGMCWMSLDDGIYHITKTGTLELYYSGDERIVFTKPVPQAY